MLRVFGMLFVCVYFVASLSLVVWFDWSLFFVCVRFCLLVVCVVVCCFVFAFGVVCLFVAEYYFVLLQLAFVVV